MMLTETNSPAQSSRAGSSLPAGGRALSYALFALAGVLGLNSLLGPVFFDAIDYSLSESLHNQLIGLDVVSLLLVAPLAGAAALLVRRGSHSGAVLALAPATYTVYMFAQYIVGPGYETYPPVLLFHLLVFVLSGVITVGAWTAIDADRLPTTTARLRRSRSWVLLGLGAFVVLRYLPALLGSFRQDPLTAEFRAEPAFFWSIFLMDLGIVVPAAVAGMLLLRAGSRSGPRAMYGLVGWFALVPPSVAAMAVTMVVNDDPHASPGSMVLFVGSAAVFGIFAWRVFRPLFGAGPLVG